jgi:hypothetical protein
MSNLTSFQPLLDDEALISLGLFGGAAGFSTEGDVITTAADGTDLNVLWTEFQQAVNYRNANRQRLIDFLTYRVTNPVEQVPQASEGGDFELASEFGVPKSIRPETEYFNLGFPFDWYDTANRFTWRFLAEASAEQLRAINAQVLEADNRLLFNDVLKTLFQSTNRTATINKNPYTVYAFYNNDGTTPPSVGATTFTNTHTHYFVSGAATVDPGDLEQLIDAIEEHGYTASNGAELVIMANKIEGDTIRNFRSVVNGGTGRYDFVAATGQPSILIPVTQQTEGGRAPATLRGMNVIGTYGPAIIIQEDYIPAKYLVAFATGGTASLTNPVGLREHANPQLRGLRLVKGRSNDYPLQDAIYQRGFGTGIRQRGAGAVTQIKAAGSYAPPAAYTR